MNIVIYLDELGNRRVALTRFSSGEKWREDYIERQPNRKRAREHVKQILGFRFVHTRITTSGTEDFLWTLNYGCVVNGVQISDILSDCLTSAFEAGCADEWQDKGQDGTLDAILAMSVNDLPTKEFEREMDCLGGSMRAANCFNNANICYIGKLVRKSEQEMLKYRNFGKKTLALVRRALKAINPNLDFGLISPVGPKEEASRQSQE